MKNKAYTEVLEVLKYADSNDYNKIPKEIINNMKSNMDTNYKFQYNIETLNVSPEASGIISDIYSKYIMK